MQCRSFQREDKSDLHVFDNIRDIEQFSGNALHLTDLALECGFIRTFKL